MIKRILERPALLFALVLLWKMALLIFTAQPVPSNDAFFYDGPVVNLLLHGKYANPSLVLALPISGGEVFCAYPPLYQVALLGWFSMFGVSALSAMFFHLLLFAIYLWVLLEIFRRLNLKGGASTAAAAFLFVITFHDRPDSLAHVLGILAVYCWVRSRKSLSGQPAGGPAASLFPVSWRSARQGWTWAAVIFVVLGLATGLQIGALYFLFLWIGMFITAWIEKESFPMIPMLALAVIPPALLALVILGFPHLWNGFLEHARQTPSLTGWRVPRFSEVLKTLRTVPGILIVVALMPGWLRERNRLAATGRSALWFVTLTSASATSVVIVASLSVLTPNSIFFVSYLQPLIVASFLGMIPALIEPGEDHKVDTEPDAPWFRIYQILGNRPTRLAYLAFLVLAAIGSIRAMGMSTWGIVCANDFGYSKAVKAVSTELDSFPPQSPVVLSSAYLYEAVRHNNVRSYHSDWLAPAQRGAANKDLEALIALKPSKIILTQFDYYRRYESVLDELKRRQELASFKMQNTARIRTPDSFPSLQKIVQHISWAPIIVSLSWK